MVVLAKTCWVGPRHRLLSWVHSNMPLINNTCFTVLHTLSWDSKLSLSSRLANKKTTPSLRPLLPKSRNRKPGLGGWTSWFFMILCATGRCKGNKYEISLLSCWLLWRLSLGPRKHGIRTAQNWTRYQFPSTLPHHRSTTAPGAVECRTTRT